MFKERNQVYVARGCDLDTHQLLYLLINDDVEMFYTNGEWNIVYGVSTFKVFVFRTPGAIQFPLILNFNHALSIIMVHVLIIFIKDIRVNVEACKDSQKSRS